MKTRTGFVSNSSSSSFCIFGCLLDTDFILKNIGDDVKAKFIAREKKRYKKYGESFDMEDQEYIEQDVMTFVSDIIEMKKLKIGIKNQGFYILRNYRQISKADNLNGLWEAHNSLNRIRAEIIFSGNLDSAMGVNYTKHNIKPVQAIVDKIQNDIMPQVMTLKKRFEKYE